MNDPHRPLAADASAARQRDHGLRRLSRATRTAAVSSVAAAVMLAGYLGLARPAHHSGTTVTTGSSTTNSSGSGDSSASTSSPDSAQYGDDTLRPSYDAPSTADSSPSATTGAT